MQICNSDKLPGGGGDSDAQGRLAHLKLSSAFESPEDVVKMWILIQEP